MRSYRRRKTRTRAGGRVEDKVHRCRVRPCGQIKGQSNHWFVAAIDVHGQLGFKKFTSMAAFREAANVHGALEICSEGCLHTHLSRWVSGEITAREMPAGPSPAVLDEARGELTCWVSDIYRSHAKWGQGVLEQYSQTRIVNYMDDGQKRSIWCFNYKAFDRVEQTAGSYVKFKVKRNGEYVNVIDVLEIDGRAFAAETRRGV